MYPLWFYTAGGYAPYDFTQLEEVKRVFRLYIPYGFTQLRNIRKYISIPYGFTQLDEYSHQKTKLKSSNPSSSGVRLNTSIKVLRYAASFAARFSSECAQVRKD